MKINSTSSTVSLSGNNNDKLTKKSKQASAIKNWDGTLNNYTKEDIDAIIKSSTNVYSYVFQQETGENGTKHLQCFFYFLVRTRTPSDVLPKGMSLRRIDGRNWQKRIKACIKYCSDPNKRDDNCIVYANIPYPKPLKILESGKFYDWQKNIIKICETEPNDRTVNYIWQKKGCKGKSALTKWLCVKMNAILVGGSNSDMKFAIAKQCIKGVPPEIVIIDLPRSSKALSYRGIEEVKNGCFFSTKYESGMCIFNSPHIFIFANVKPKLKMLSKDRWNIIHL